jgi:hypothetical protein
MALQDLTPQLRTRLNRMERAVGWFVLLATALLLVGFVYFLRNTAQRKGWFTPKYTYQTGLNNAAGLRVGDPVRLMGFTAGNITEIIPNAPDDWFGVTIRFTIQKPHYGYVWDDSQVKVSSDLLGNRFLEITKGQFGVPTIMESTNKIATAMLQWQIIRAERQTVIEQLRQAYPDLETSDAYAFNWTVREQLTRVSEAQSNRFYTDLEEIYWLEPAETPAVNERIEQLVARVETALPNILDLTNRLNAVLNQSTALASNLNLVALGAQPAVSNFAFLTEELRGPGAFGNWAWGTNSQQSLEATLASANVLLQNTDTNLTALLESFEVSLMNLAEITSNLNAQVQANPEMLGALSQAVGNTDELVQGLKRHWLLRSAFKKKK